MTRKKDGTFPSFLDEVFREVLTYCGVVCFLLNFPSTTFSKHTLRCH